MAITTPPSAPTATAVSNTAIDVVPVADAVGDNGTVTYRMEWSDEAFFASPLGSTAYTDNTTINVTGLTINTQYHFRALAVDDDAIEVPSNVSDSEFTTNDTTPPAFVSGAVDAATGQQLDLTFDESVDGSGVGNWIILADGNPITIDSVGGGLPMSLIWATDVIYEGQTVTVQYIAGTLVDSNGNAAASFGPTAVTNSSTVPPPPPPPTGPTFRRLSPGVGLRRPAFTRGV